MPTWLITNVASFVIGYLSSWLVARQTRLTKALRLEVMGREMIFENFEGDRFDLRYEGQPVQNLYGLVVRLWNRGRDRIISSDISKRDPVMIVMDQSAKILGTPSVYMANEGIDFNVIKVKDNAYRFEFDCLNASESVVVEFKYTGNPRAVVKRVGRVFGQDQSITSGVGEARTTPAGRFGALIAALFITFLYASPLVAIVWILVWSFLRGWTLPHVQDWPQPLLLFTTFGASMIILYVTFFTAKLIKKYRSPKGFLDGQSHSYSNLDSFKAIWSTVLTGRKYMASTSVYDYGQLITFEDEDSLDVGHAADKTEQPNP